MIRWQAVQSPEDKRTHQISTFCELNQPLLNPLAGESPHKPTLVTENI